ncbi:hypothetical protein ACFLQU_05815 [Verrucomicrobiota bacterium]
MTRKRRRNGLLESLSAGEAKEALRLLLERHPELRAEAKAVARDMIADVAAEDIAEDVKERVLCVDHEALNSRAGSHSWGYVEPSEAAWELLEEAIEDLVEDMKRRKEAGAERASQEICVGLVLGLYSLRQAKSDGALGWAPGFPAETAAQVVSGFVAIHPASRRTAAGKKILKELGAKTGAWMEILQRAVRDASR